MTKGLANNISDTLFGNELMLHIFHCIKAMQC